MSGCPSDVCELRRGQFIGSAKCLVRFYLATVTTGRVPEVAASVGHCLASLEHRLPLLDEGTTSLDPVASVAQ